MQSLEPPDSHRLEAAQGWLELRNHLEANEELENISASARSHPDVLEIRWQIYAKEKKWSACVDIANGIMSQDPDRDTGWIHHSVALHELKRTEEAYMHLAAVADDFPNNWRLPYNLACYCAQLGRNDEAQDWLKKAIVLDDKQAPNAAIDDPDLKPLWDSMSTTIWKKAE